MCNHLQTPPLVAGGYTLIFTMVNTIIPKWYEGVYPLPLHPLGCGSYILFRFHIDHRLRCVIYVNVTVRMCNQGFREIPGHFRDFMKSLMWSKSDQGFREIPDVVKE